MSEPKALKDMMGTATGAVWEKASPERRRAYEAASGMRRTFAVWNEVMETERGRDHVTGLYFVAEECRLVVYVDAPAWCQELFMMREVLRTRMSLKGVELSEIAFKVSKDGYRRDPRLSMSAAAAGAAGGGTLARGAANGSPADAARSAGFSAAARSGGAGLSAGARPGSPSSPAPPAPLTDEERARVREATSAVADDDLRRALEKAMTASFEWKKGRKSV